LRKLLRGSYSDEDILSYISEIWRSREDRYSELRNSMREGMFTKKVEMFKVGG